MRNHTSDQGSKSQSGSDRSGELLFFVLPVHALDGLAGEVGLFLDATPECDATYLQTESAQKSVVTLQQSMGLMLENQIHKFMLARGDEEFAIWVIDAAAPLERATDVRPSYYTWHTARCLPTKVGALLAYAVRANPGSSGPNVAVRSTKMIAHTILVGLASPMFEGNQV